ncbi:MAG TPA: leucine--tRNA ligase [Elusimicrobiota bacterium]|nr:leucine--tRNA ligase [Elusimicrobiota bacterium]
MKPERIPWADIAAKWQKRWEDAGLFKAPRTPRAGRKFYCLDMFPYPSADGLHVGHPEGYTATDIVCRYKRMRGFDVLHPMGWDAFGLPAENFAIATGTHPADVTRKNVANFKRQIKALGFSYDWSREIDTTDPEYYKCTQWIFLRLLQKGLAYESTAPINWCPSCQTGLANEEVFSGKCERCGSAVEKKNLRQWVLRITAYADRLEKDLAGLDWPASTLAMQRHWIGRSEGAEADFALEPGGTVTVFTTRPDTLYGATYLALAPEHPLVSSLALPPDHQAAVQAYIAATKNKTDLERTDLAKEKTGVFTGIYAFHPLTKAKIPVWLADYVLPTYGSGAVMAVPAHDERDWDFAKKYHLAAPWVVLPKDGLHPRDKAFTEDGVAVDSPAIEGLDTAAAKQKMISHLEENKLGRRAVHYRLRDWIFSRQRYWGEPIPVIHCPKDGLVPVPEKDLPVLLPDVKDYKPTGTGESPLAAVDAWVNVPCPKCGGPARRETNTMPQWAGSCWYYLRYLDPQNQALAWAPEVEKAWMPVDLYVGGAEHAVLHLLYARFWHKVLYDLGAVTTPEPFQKLRHQGMILSFSFRDARGVYHPHGEVSYAEDGGPSLSATGEKLDSQIEKMSKSKKNVVNPDLVIADYGADAFRLYEMFMGPFEQSKPWDMRSIEGVSRFLRKAWALVWDALENKTLSEKTAGLAPLRHKTVKKVTEDVESFGFNTAISALMIYANEIQKQDAPARADLETLLILLHPFAPHLTEELWEKLGHERCLAQESWPAWDEALLVEEKVEYAVQINGKVRASFEFGRDAGEKDVREAALALEKIRTAVSGKTVVKAVVVPNRLVSLVVK